MQLIETDDDLVAFAGVWLKLFTALLSVVNLCSIKSYKVNGDSHSQILIPHVNGIRRNDRLHQKDPVMVTFFSFFSIPYLIIFFV